MSSLSLYAPSTTAKIMRQATRGGGGRSAKSILSLLPAPSGAKAVALGISRKNLQPISVKLNLRLGDSLQKIERLRAPHGPLTFTFLRDLGNYHIVVVRRQRRPDRQWRQRPGHQPGLAANSLLRPARKEEAWPCKAPQKALRRALLSRCSQRRAEKATYSSRVGESAEILLAH